MLTSYRWAWIRSTMSSCLTEQAEVADGDGVRLGRHRGHAKIQIPASRELRSERLRRQASPRHSAKTYNPHSSLVGWSFGMHEAEQLAGALEPNWKMLSATRRRRDRQRRTSGRQDVQQG